MSFQIKPRYGKMVVCDACGDFGVIGDWDWRKMRCDELGQPMHLCRVCRPSAVWCSSHQQYHLPNSLHRRPCAICGGLFTSQVSQNIEHCPQCRRDHPAPMHDQQPKQAAGLVALFMRWHAHGHTGTKSS
jgi:hypothetical protein